MFKCFIYCDLFFFSLEIFSCSKVVNLFFYVFILEAL